MSSKSNKVKPDERQNAQQTVDTSRRSFAKVGVAVAPVMMTLMNRSAWGAGLTNGCTTYSGFTSISPLNSHAVATAIPEWKTLVEWRGFINLHSTPKSNDKVAHVFPGFGFNSNLSFGDALSNSDLTGYKVALLLNKSVAPQPILNTLINLDPLDPATFTIYQNFDRSICVSG